MLCVFTSKLENRYMVNQPQLLSWPFCNLWGRKHCSNSSWRWHRRGPQWQDPHSRGEGNSWRWTMFFLGMSILCNNCDEVNNMPAQWIVPISRGNYLWKSCLPQGNTCAFFCCSIICFCVQVMMYWWSDCSCADAEKQTDLSSMSFATLKMWLQMLFQMECLPPCAMYRH